jgi:hypothetical protein
MVSGSADCKDILRSPFFEGVGTVESCGRVLWARTGLILNSDLVEVTRGRNVVEETCMYVKEVVWRSKWANA